MTDFEFIKKFDQNFIGRVSELKWLDEHLFRRSYSFDPIVISGATGVGKTSLIKYWLSSRRISYTPLWLDLSSEIGDNPLGDLLKRIDNERERYQYDDRLIVVIDGSDIWNEKQHQDASGKIFNYKVVSSLVFTRQRPLNFNRSEQLILEPLSENETADLIQKLLSGNLKEAQLLEAIDASKGYPLAIKLLSQLLKGENINSILTALNQPLYELSNNILVPKNEIITSTSPIIVSANEKLVTSLKKQPSDLHKLSPRDFEKLLSELLRDMGWEVELTKQTRDGGSDILAYLNTDIGRLLCLVEAKHYREDRKIGVDLVRTLYGTLCDAQANSAMLVTSSSFTSDAKEFQQKHKYQLTLRDYADVVTWILKYGNKQNHFT